MPTTRERIEAASLPVLTRLSGLHRLIPFVVMLALLLAGVFVGGVAGFVLVLLAVLIVAWLLYLSWPRLGGQERLMRFAVLLLASAIAVVQLFPHR